MISRRKLYQSHQSFTHPKFRLFKKYLAELPERRVHMNATTVQNFYRTYLAKQIFSERREAHLQWQLEQQRLKASRLPQNKWWSGIKRGWRSISRTVYKSKLETAMALRIQMWWRQTLARILLRTLKRHVYTEYSKTNYRAAVKIQAQFRKEQSKQVFRGRKREVSAVRIESVVRGHRGRKEARARSLVKHRAASATKLQNWWRSMVTMRLARVALDIRRRHSLLIIRFQSVIRGWLATRRVEALREQCRWEQERADCGLARYIYSIRRKKDNLLLLSAFGSISDDPEGPMQRVFAYWCSTRRVATSGAPRMSGVVFLKMIGSLPGIMNKTVDNNRLDIIFERAKRKGQKTLAYNEWVTALQYVGDTRLPHVVAHREVRDDHARLLRLIDLCMASRWGSDIARDVHIQADNLIRRAAVAVQRWRRNQGEGGSVRKFCWVVRCECACSSEVRVRTYGQLDT